MNNLLNNLLRLAQQHAASCQRYSELINDAHDVVIGDRMMGLPVDLVLDARIRGLVSTANYHAVKAFELSAQAARS